MAVKHKHERLYRLSPWLYNNISALKAALRNWAFVVANIRMMRFSVNIGRYGQVAKEYSAEFDRITNIIASDSRRLGYPRSFNMNRKEGLLLYYLVRTLRPRMVLETGVANGFSTRLVLAALKRNGIGRLVSVDVDKDVGGLVEDPGSGRWRLIIDRPGKGLERALKGISRVDLFIHDSDHSYKNMLWEFGMVRPKLSGSGIVYSDDVNGNRAFLEFVRKNRLSGVIIPTFRKSFGIASKRPIKI